MRSWLATLLKNLFGDSVARVLGGAGLSLATAALLLPAITSALNAAASGINGIPSDVLNVALLFGFGEAMSLIGSAMLTRVAMNSTRLGLKKATTT